MINWEFTAELFALSSGLALVWPALRLNRNLRKAQIQEGRAASGRSKWVNKLRRNVARAYTDPQWNLLEESLTIAGVVLLILSSAIKLAESPLSADQVVREVEGKFRITATVVESVLLDRWLLAHSPEISKIKRTAA